MKKCCAFILIDLLLCITIFCERSSLFLSAASRQPRLLRFYSRNARTISRLTSLEKLLAKVATKRVQAFHTIEIQGLFSLLPSKNQIFLAKAGGKMSISEFKQNKNSERIFSVRMMQFWNQIWFRNKLSPPKFLHF